MKTTMFALVAVAALLAGCQGSTDPADPPSSEDALPTDTAPTTDAAPTTSAPDDAEVTSQPVTTEADGPPELPDAAQEDSEAGAEAFALHYIDMINYTSMHPEEGLLEPLAADGCKSCANHEQSVAYMIEHGEWVEHDGLEVQESVSLYRVADSEANVRVLVRQVPQPVLSSGGEVVEEISEQVVTMDFAVSWEDNWTVDEIRVDVGTQ